MDTSYEMRDHLERYKKVKSVLKFSNYLDVDETNFFSFAIPTYRRENMLIRAINSIISQETEIPYEIVIVDNELHETEDSDLIEFLKSVRNVKIRYFQNESNIGMFGNWNRCIELANAEWVAMLHDDDYLLPSYFKNLKKIVPLLKNDIGYIKMLTVSGRKEQCGLIEFTKNDFCILGPCRIGYVGTPSCGSLFNKNAFFKIGGFNEEHYPSEDAYFIAKLAISGGYKVYMTTVQMGVIDQDDSTTYKRDTIIAFTREFHPYFEYYSTWSKLSKFFYSFFFNEITHKEEMQIMNLITNSSYLSIVDKANTASTVRNILKCEKYSKLRFLLLRILYKAHEFKINHKPVILK